MPATKTKVTLSLEVDGFVGLRQAQAASNEVARWLRTVLPYDVRTLDAATTETDLGDEGPNLHNVLDGTALQGRMPAPTATSTPPMGEHAPEHAHEENPPAEDSPYFGMTVEALRQLAGERELEGRAGMRTKAQLIAGLEAQDAEAAVPA